jgi:hypothetical protein
LRYAKHGITRTNGHTLQLPTLHQHALQHAQYKQILEHYAPTFLPIINHKDKTNYTLPDFIQNASLHGMQRYFYHTYQQSVKQNFHLHSPPDIHPYLPSLLSPLTSIPLASMSRRTPTNRFSNDEFRILLQRKLRLPIFSPTVQERHCTCRTRPILDPYGDHLFSCTAASKSPMHNHIRDTLYHIFTKLGPIAQLVRTPTDIVLEPPTLLPTFPTLRPADIGIQLLPRPAYSKHEYPEPYLAIDITFTHIPNYKARALSQVPPDIKTPTHQVHDDSAKLKFNVPHAHHLRYQGISLLPFMIDHLGGLGYQATDFLFGSQSQIPAASLPPEWTTSTFRTNPEAYALFQDSLDTIPSGILPSATHHWQLGYPKPPRFGRTYHTYTPTQWATQALALNLTKTLSQHIITHRNRILTHSEHQRRIHKQATTLSAPYYLPPPPFLLPSDTTLEPTAQLATESFTDSTSLSYQ